MKLTLIRHGQSSNNALPEYQRIEDPGLTALGEEQAESLRSWADTAQPTTLLVSPFRRTLLTARPIHEATNLACQVWIDLHERGGCYSGYQPSNFQGRPGMSGEQIQADFPETILVDDIGKLGWWQSKPRETDEEAHGRAQRIAERLSDTYAHTDEHVACVMHADFKLILTSHLLGRDVDSSFPPIYHNASVTTLVRDSSGGFVAEIENSTEHLPSSIRP